MKTYLAIVLQTIRSALRSKVFHVLAVLILLAVILLPMTAAGDGTAVSLVQISVTFSLGVVVALISTTALWLSCSQLSTEIEKYSIHLVVVKPCPKFIIWLGKWTGIFVMHAAILVVSAIVIFILIQIRVKTGDFSEKEIKKLNAEVRVGRMAFWSDTKNYDSEVKAEYERKKPTGDEASAKAEIKRQLIAKEGEIRAGAFKEWTFSNIQTDKDKIFLRFRLFSGSTTSTDQQMMYFTWKIRDPEVGAADPFFELYPDGKGDGKFHSAKGGAFHEWEVDAKYIDKETHQVTIRFYNMNHQVENFGQNVHNQEEIPENETPEQRQEREKQRQASIDRAKIAILQQADGPLLLIAEASFATNYIMAIVQAMLQIAFLTALGCAVSAAFSTPVAAFVAISYLVIGLAVQAAIDAPLRNEDGGFMYKSNSEYLLHMMAQGVDVVVVSVDDFDATTSLANGRLVTNRRVEKVMRNMRRNFDSPMVCYSLGTMILLLRWILIFGLGIWIFQKRELGAVIRK